MSPLFKTLCTFHFPPALRWRRKLPRAPSDFLSSGRRAEGLSASPALAFTPDAQLGDVEGSRLSEHAPFLPLRTRFWSLRVWLAEACGVAQYAVSVLTTCGSSGPVSDLKASARRRLHTFALLFAQPVLRRRDPTAAAAVNISFPNERETQRWRERDGERGGWITERTTVLGGWKVEPGGTQIFAERGAVWIKRGGGYCRGKQLAARPHPASAGRCAFSVCVSAPVQGRAGPGEGPPLYRHIS